MTDLDDVSRAIGRIEGQIGSFDDRFERMDRSHREIGEKMDKILETVDGRFKTVETRVGSLERFKNQGIGVYAGISLCFVALGSAIKHFVEAMLK